MKIDIEFYYIIMTQQLKNGQYSYLEADQLGKGSFGKVFKGKITANN